MAFVLDHLERSSAAGGDVGEVVLIAELFDGRGGIATAANGEGFAVEFLDGLADGLGTALEFRLFEHAHRAVPEDHFGFGDGLGEEFFGLGADIDAFEAFGDFIDHFDLAAFDRFEGIGDDGVDGEDDLVAGLLEAVLRVFEGGFVEEGGADLLAAGFLEGIAHRAADDDVIALIDEGVDDFDLVGDFETAEDRDIGTVFGFDLDAAGEVLDLFDHEEAEEDGLAFGLEDLGDADGGGVGAVGGAEGVHDERVDEAGPFLSEFGVVLFFARLITGVLGEEDLAILKRIDGVLEGFAAVFGAEGDVDVMTHGFGDVLLKRLDGDAEVVLLHLAIDVFLGLFALLELLPVDFAEVGHEKDAGAFLEQGFDGGDGRADAVVIGNDLSLMRNVEVDADVDFLSVEVG